MASGRLPATHSEVAALGGATNCGYRPTPNGVEGEWKHVGKAGFTTHDEADDAMQAARVKYSAGVDLAATIPTLASYSTSWLDSLDLEAATVGGYRRIFKLHVNPAIGDLRLDKVSVTRLNRLYADLQRPDVARSRAPNGLSKSSVRKVHVALSAMFEAAVAEKLLAVNPARQGKAVKVPTTKAVKREQVEMVTWSGAQMGEFLTWNRDVLDDDVHALWWTVAYTGMRRSEVLALQWGDIDLDEGRIRVRRALDTGIRGGAIKSTKSGRARTVDIDPTTVALLRKWRTVRASLSFEFVKSAGYVFGTLAGDARNPTSVSQMFTLRVEKARKVIAELPVITLHGLRHTHASVLLEAGENPKVVQERLGHTTITTTMDVWPTLR